MASKTRLTERVKAFDVAGVLADLDERPDLLAVRGDKGRTALHMMLAKDSGPQRLAELIALGARTDIPGPDSRTVAEILTRKKDPAYRALIAPAAP